MQLYRSLDDIHLDGAWLTIGVYDGVHLGHQAILSDLVKGAHEAGLPAVVLTFNPHPLAVLRPDVPRMMLTSVLERAALLEELGVDAVVVQKFDRPFSLLTAREFLVQLKEKLSFSRFFAGYDFAMGRDRGGDIPTIRSLGLELGFEVQVFVQVAAGEAPDELPISSSRIRQALSEGKVELANTLLGRPYSLSGVVETGAQRGRTIGIPTANLAIPAGRMVPATGVYACVATVAGSRYAAAANIGVRPTFEPDTVLEKVEVHLLGFDGDIYNEVVEVAFLKRLRGEQKFDGIDALVAQIHDDIARTREAVDESLS